MPNFLCFAICFTSCGAASAISFRKTGSVSCPHPPFVEHPARPLDLLTECFLPVASTNHGDDLFPLFRLTKSAIMGYISSL